MSTASATGLLLVIASLPAAARAQQPEVLPLDSAMVIAFRNNGLLKAAALNVEQAEAAKGSGWNIDKTGFFVENEDVSTATPDGIFKMGLSQRLEFPTVYGARHAVAKERVGLAGSAYDAVARDLERDVRLAWNRLEQVDGELRLVRSLDSLVAELERVAELRHSTGDAPLVEKASAMARRQQVALQRDRIERELVLARIELQRLLRTERIIAPLPDATVPEIDGLPDSLGAATPLIQLAEQRVVVAHREKQVAAHMTLPDLQGRWFDQRLYGVEDNFRGYSLTVGLPLAFWDHRARTRSASLRERIAREEADQLTTDVQAAYRTALERARQTRVALRLYDNTLMAQAAIIERTATEAYKAGGISYVELTALLTQSTDLRLGQVQARAAYLEALVHLDHFTGTLFPFTHSR